MSGAVSCDGARCQSQIRWHLPTQIPLYNDVRHQELTEATESRTLRFSGLRLSAEHELARIRNNDGSMLSVLLIRWHVRDAFCDFVAPNDSTKHNMLTCTRSAQVSNES